MARLLRLVKSKREFDVETEVDGGQSVYPDDLGPEIREQHAAERRRPNARHLDDAHSCQRTHRFLLRHLPDFDNIIK